MPFSPRIVSFNKGLSWIDKHDRCFRSGDISQYPTHIGYDFLNIILVTKYVIKSNKATDPVTKLFKKN